MLMIINKNKFYFKVKELGIQKVQFVKKDYNLVMVCNKIFDVSTYFL